MTCQKFQTGLIGGLMTIIGLAGQMAHAAADATVAGNGTVAIKRQPELLRMRVEISGKGKTVQEAMANLKTRREAAEAKLAALGADKNSLVRGEPHVTPPADRQLPSSAYVTPDGRPLKKSAKKPALPTIVTADLTAEWPLKAASADDLLIAAETLVEKIRAADVAGAKDAQPATAEEQEEAEEAKPQDNDKLPPGEPRFLYIARIGPDDRKKAMADAFAKAKADAMESCQAAGVELGPLVSLSGAADTNQTSAEGYFFEMANAESSVVYAGSSPALERVIDEVRQRNLTNADDAHEAVGVEPSALIFHVTIMATFALK